MGIVQGLMMSYGGKKGRTPGANTVAYYPLTTDANDYSGNARHGTPSNMSYSGGWGIFNGSSSRIAISGTSFPLNNFTWHTTINASSFSGFRGILGITGTGSGMHHQTNGGQLGTYLYGANVGISGGATLSTSTDYLITITYGGGYLKSYINGVYNTRVSSGTNMSSFSTAYIGYAHDNSRYRNGKMKDMIIEDRVRTDVEILAYYNGLGI